jgi:valyl-tRNA synthetase
MSKTKGNVIDPLEIIQRFGTDATRFTLAAMAAPGTDIAFNESRTEGYRNFANKIWNAARFMFMNVERAEPSLQLGQTAEGGPPHMGVAGFESATLEDRWMLSRFNRVAADVNQSLRTYRFHEAANRIYDFFWGEFCDWYIELIKPRLQKVDSARSGQRMLDESKKLEKTRAELQAKSGEDKVEKFKKLEEEATAGLRRVTGYWRLDSEGLSERVKNTVVGLESRIDVQAREAATACENLVSLFEASLRLLHPVMPFITEEIWQAIYDGKPPLKSIALAPYPQADEKQLDPAAESQMTILQDLIVNVRNLRAELKVEQKLKVPIQIFAHDPEIRALLEQNINAIERLATVDNATFVDQPLSTMPASRHTAVFDVHVLYERKIDVAAECERLKKELEQIEKGIAGGQRQLSNEQFLAKAPASVVENLRKQQQELAVLREKAASKMKKMGCA